MQIISTREFHIEEPTAVAIGKFDSLHLGHQVILNRLKTEAECSLKTAVLSFMPNPEVFFGKYENGFVLTDDEKIKVLKAAGIDYYILYPFDEVTAKTEPKVFLEEILLKQLNMQVLVAGEDLSFGKGGLGNAEFVKELSKSLDFRACICPKLHIDGEEISATLVRKAVLQGDMEKCSRLLGRAYRVSGIVQKGNQLGRTIGVPTCNIVSEKEKLLPPKGVYFTKVILGNKIYYGVTNVGTKPTVSDSGAEGIETHILQFEEDVYGEVITLDFMHYHRPEYKFESIEALGNQLFTDIGEAKKYFVL